MNSKKIRTDAELQNCIYFQQVVEVWVGGELDDVCYVSEYSAGVIKVSTGYSYLRSNVMVVVR